MLALAYLLLLVSGARCFVDRSASIHFGQVPVGLDKHVKADRVGQVRAQVLCVDRQCVMIFCLAVLGPWNGATVQEHRRSACKMLTAQVCESKDMLFFGHFEITTWTHRRLIAEQFIGFVDNTGLKLGSAWFLLGSIASTTSGGQNSLNVRLHCVVVRLRSVVCVRPLVRFDEGIFGEFTVGVAAGELGRALGTFLPQAGINGLFGGNFLK